MPEETLPFFDIEKAVEEYGRAMFEDNARTRKQKRIRKKHFVEKIPCIDVQIDWSHLSMSDETIWAEITDKDFKSSGTDDSTPNGTGDASPAKSTGKADDMKSVRANILFETDFTNDTEETQEYTLKIEKTTKSTCTTEIENGVTNGVELSATLSFGDIMEIGAGFSREVSLTKMEGQTFENELTWGAESMIKVPKGKSARAEMQVVEKQQEGRFTVLTSMQGFVKIKYIYTKDNSQLFSQTGKIKTIVERYIKEVGKKFKGIEYKPDGKVVFKTSGKCDFRFGIKQFIKVTEDPDARGK